MAMPWSGRLKGTSPRTGRLIRENGTRVNIADALSIEDGSSDAFVTKSIDEEKVLRAEAFSTRIDEQVGSGSSYTMLLCCGPAAVSIEEIDIATNSSSVDLAIYEEPTFSGGDDETDMLIGFNRIEGVKLGGLTRTDEPTVTDDGTILDRVRIFGEEQVGGRASAGGVLGAYRFILGPQKTYMFKATNNGDGSRRISVRIRGYVARNEGA